MVRDNRKIAAILAADVVDYSRLMGADEAGTLAALAVRRGLFEEQVREFDGRVFGSVGDSLMAEFASAVNAVLCAQAIQERVARENEPLPAARHMLLRIGVNLGDVIQSDGGVAGDAVNVAARLQALAKPGGVLISGPVYDQVHLKVPARYVAAGVRQVKNIAEPVRTFEVLPAAPPGLAGRIASVSSRMLSRRVLRAAAAVAALAFAVALGLFWREIPLPGTDKRLGALFQPQEPEPESNTIAVLPFRNLSGDPANDYIGEGLADELAQRLSRIPGLKVSSQTSAFAFRGKDLGVREIADRLGVAYIVEGSVMRLAERVRIKAALVDRRSGDSRWSNSYDPEPGDYFTIVDDIGRRVITALEELLGTGTGASPPATSVGAGSGAAYDYFLQGLSYLRQPKSAKTLDAAEGLFTRSLAEQPGFGRAQAGLCETRVERYALDRQPALVRAAEDACRKAQALDSSAQEVHMAIGSLRLATGDAAQAEAAYRQALALAPNDADALLGLASALETGERLREAERIHEQAIAAQPRYAAAHLAYGNFLLSHSRAADAIRPYERAAEFAPDNPTAFNNLGAALLYLGNFDRAADAFSHSVKLDPRRASYSNLGTVAYYRGRHAEATDMFRKAIALAPADHRLWGNLADALYFDSRRDDAREAYRRALDLAEGELAVNPKHSVNQAQAAYYSTRLGDAKSARERIASALADGDDAYVHYYVALAELGLGDRTMALVHVKRARELGYPEVLLRAAPELGDIRAMIR